MASRSKQSAKVKGPKRRPTARYPAPASYPCRPGTVRGVLVGGTRYCAEGKERYCLDILDLDSVDPVQRVRLSFLAHGFTYDPLSPSRAAVFEKRGPGGVYVDLVERAVLAEIVPLNNHAFYGHGTYASGGDLLYVVESNLIDGQGAISVRDGRTFAVMGQMSTYGARPHDCVLVDQGSTLAITNGGGDVGTSDLPCVTFVDIATQKLLEKHEVPNPLINTGHIAFAGRRDFAVVSAPRDGIPDASSPGGICLRSGKKPWRQMTEPSELMDALVGETLSVAADPNTGMVIATSPLANTVTCWNIFAKRLIKVLQLVDPRGVAWTLDRAQIVIGFGADARIQFRDPETLSLIEQVDRGAPLFGGSHIYNWAYPAAPKVGAS